MAGFSDNLRLPSGLDEGDLLSWIEGEPMLATKRAALAAWLAREPELARVIEAMRQDRVGLQSLGNEVAPAGLLNAVAAQVEPLLERQMLLGLAEGTDLQDHPPVSVVRPARQSVLGAFFADRLGRRIAVAAAMLLLVGGSTYFIAQSLSGPGPGSGPIKPRVARSTMESSPLEADRTIAEAGNSEEPVVTAMGAAEPVVPEAPPPDAMTLAAAAPPPAQDPFDAPYAALARADGDAEAAAMGPFLPEQIDPLRAAELARQGRLVIRLKAKDPGLIIRPDRLATRLTRAQSPAWRLEGEAPQQLAQAVAQPFPADLEQRLPPPRRELVMAGADPARFPDVPQAMLYGPPAPSLREAAAKGPVVYSVQTRLEPSTLTRLRQIIAQAGGEVVFEELAEPLPGSDEPALTAQAMLWWGQSPAGWTRWARVPVVIDVAR